MRISDWSSDVCSSDLAIIAAGLRLEFHRDDVRARSRLRHREAADVLARDQPGQVFGFLFGIAPAADLVDAEVGMRAVAATDRSRGAADLLHRNDVIEKIGKHTSELQSLMRISYAVFCLTKTNKPNPPSNDLHEVP